MTVHIKPELEAIIAEDVKTGAYASVDDYVERAIEMMHEQEEWLARDREEIAEQIEHGWEQAERGELIDGDAARAVFEKHREEWLKRHAQPRS